MRLIDADRLKEAIHTDFSEHFTLYHDTDQTALFDMVMDDIDEMPTAFDKEKVINEIHISSAGMALSMSVSSSYAEGYIDAAKDIIKIIEKGGIE